MTCLVGKHIYISACSIKIRENKGRFVIGNISAVASAHLSFFADQIQQFSIRHIFKELVSFL
ncbi:hypothetical protein SDC9_153361 [bioreactor metagenome]|uniref:Uncharacterized protein n=1 Tax=bioreactor metagenome TaxID=1076179 RepID=A0A645EXG5_9ZZZZ